MGHDVLAPSGDLGNITLDGLASLEVSGEIGEEVDEVLGTIDHLDGVHGLEVIDDLLELLLDGLEGTNAVLEGVEAIEVSETVGESSSEFGGILELNSDHLTEKHGVDHGEGRSVLSLVVGHLLHRLHGDHFKK